MPNPEHVFGGHKIKVGVKLKKGGAIPKEDSATFVFQRGEEELGRVEVAIEKHVFSKDEFKGEFEVPEPKPEEDSYSLKCTLEVGTNTFDYGQEWEVWHQRINVTTRKKVEGTLTDFGFTALTLVAQGEETRHEVGSTGKLSLLRPQPGPCEVRVPSPWKFVQWLDGKDKGLEQVMEVEVAPTKARILSHEAEEAIKTYVNVPGEGNEIELELASRAETGDLVGNQELFLEVRFTNETKRGKGDPDAPDADYQRERTVTGLSDEAKSDEDMTWKGKVTTNDQGKAKVTIYLGKGGGESCEVKVGSTSTVEDESVTFESWRKLYVQFSLSDTDRTQKAWPEDKRSVVLDTFKEVFIDVDVLADKVYPEDLDLNARSGWYDGDEIGETAGTNYFVLNIEGRGWRSLSGKIKPDDVPHEELFINVASVDLMFEVHNEVRTLYVHYEGCSCVPCQRGYTEKSSPVEKLGKDLAGRTISFGKLPTKGGLYRQEAKYELSVFDDEGKLGDSEGMQTLPEEAIKVSNKPKDDRGKVTITLPDEVVTRLQREKLEVRLYVSLMMRVEDAGAEGVSDGAHSVVLSHSAKGDTNTSNTIIHEIGHAIGMCGTPSQLRGTGTQVDRLPDYVLSRHEAAETDHYAEHGRWYEKRGHQGNHCADGLGQSDYDKWHDLDGVSAKNIFGGFKCVIYGQTMGMRNPIKWCARCQDLLKAMEVWVGGKPKG